MMAVWDCGPPPAVMSARTLFGSRVAVSAGARSSATSTKGVLEEGMPGAGDAAKFRDDPGADVQDVGGAFSHVAAQVVQHFRD